ncbi:MAG: Asp-tRNA(Asn)/Glu-tRNA(Gln) amidotransferase GatCAB subunit B [Alphaproteobacteria bacterium CG_4_10_14_0_2_um_filter_63_37]|nr:MAG: aspartyl/glutamyl-tRNA amidotransferase subunit B [Proteobacteria bacterium CG1_02_64_396]PJA23986.1 MAG: Asp-tRNA(Asn)/Glu-tRNA(Gln) amidotransferase GatCAB subunit B [Alphaproteobacteria bacterium CG_4_10_14_0_2_um_filter_63_37]
MWTYEGYEVVIGLEVHTQLLTHTKIFCGCSTAFGAAPNTQTCPVCTGQPGALPVFNKGVAEMAIRLGLATDSQIRRESVFARKNYFYPDLPKGYQISQYELPICEHGHLDIDLEGGESKRIGITRAHLEEDAGKSLHELTLDGTAIDLNRACVPLIEIVSEPELRSPEEAVAYLKKLHAIVRYIGICDGNMQEGSFRVDANVSVMRIGATVFGTRCELKNMNSFRNVQRAIEFEVARQVELIEDGGKVIQETRLYDAAKNETRSMRGKEEAHDYRYFPDPDLIPLRLSQAMIEFEKARLPELPDAKRDRFIGDYGLSRYDAGVLTSEQALADYYEAVVAGKRDAKLCANWVTGDLLGNLNKAGLDIAQSPVSSANLGLMIDRIADATISGKIAKEVFEAMMAGEHGGNPDAIIEAKGLKQVTDTGPIDAAIDEAMAENPGQLADYRSGKDKLFGFFVGQVMKKMRGKGNPALVNERLKVKLDG